MKLYDVSAMIGLLTITYLLYQARAVIQYVFHSSKLYRYIHNPDPALKLDRQLSKPWALVTGSSDGIGKALATELCSRGFNVVLHGRPSPKLAKVKKALESEFKAEVRALELDAGAIFSEAKWEDKFRRTVLAAIDGINLTLVIHNLGGHGGLESEIFSPLSERSVEATETQLNVNLRFMTHLTPLVLPILTRNTPSGIISIGSGAEIVPTPWGGVYAASKAFGRRYTSCLREEMRIEKKDVDVVSFIAGAVVTDGSRRTSADIDLMTPSTTTWAKAALDKVGYDSPAVGPYIWHQMMFSILPRLPMSWQEKVVVPIVEKMMMDFRTKKDI